jgi:TPR repeat protein
LEGAPGVPRDYGEAVKWLLKCPDSEFGFAEFALGECYFYGQGVQQNYAEAARWLLEALFYANVSADMERPYTDIGYLLCRIYELGDADFTVVVKALTGWVKQESVLEYKRGHKAYAVTAEEIEFADAGHASAQLLLSLAYTYGLGVQPDHAEAAKWFRKAAGAGNLVAQVHLSMAHVKSRGVPQDYAEAYLWLTLAESRSTGALNAFVSWARKELGHKITLEQIAEAQVWAQEWRPSGTLDAEARNAETQRLTQDLQTSLGELPRKSSKL